jgi:hypothetical protein
MINELSGVEVPVAALPQLLVSEGAGDGSLVRLSSSSSLIRSQGGTCCPPTASNTTEDSSVPRDDLKNTTLGILTKNKNAVSWTNKKLTIHLQLTKPKQHKENS